MPWGLLMLLLAGLAVLWAGLAVHTAWLLSRPPRRTYSWAVWRGLPGDPGEGPRPLEFRSWTFRSRGLDLPAWSVRGLDPDGPTVVLTHGWADSRVVMLARVGALAGLARQVVVWDMPGHGEAPGRCTLGVREPDDLLALLDAVDADGPIVLHGFSLGAGVSIVAAARAPAGRVAAVVAEAPYRLAATPARNVLRLRGLPYRATLGPALLLARLVIGRGASGGLGDADFDRAAWAAKLEAATPLLVLSGDADAVCPLEDARAIAASAKTGELVVVPGGDHAGMWLDPSTQAACVAAVDRLLGRSITNAEGVTARACGR
jgi:pimeloyl-ACP methyl ester carboxylesterase